MLWDESKTRSPSGGGNPFQKEGFTDEVHKRLTSTNMIKLRAHLEARAGEGIHEGGILPEELT